MKNVPEELPDSLDDAARHFSEFLQENGYPGDITWITSADVTVDEQGIYWVRNHPESRLQEARLRYRSGIQPGLGIALRALCANEKTTFASISIPQDAMDAEYALMGKGLKLSCPSTRSFAIVVDNPLRWLILRVWNRRRAKLLEF